MTTLSGLISLRRIFIVLFALVAPTTALLLAPVMLRNHGSELMVVSANAARPNGSDGINLKSRTSERFVAAVNGEAFTLKSTDAGVTKVGLKTSRPVFKAFGLMPDGKRLLYTELRDDRPTGELYLEDLSSNERIRITNKIVLAAAISPTDPNKIAYTYATGDAFALSVIDLSNKSEDELVTKDVYADLISWDGTGNAVHYFDTTADNAELLFPAKETVEDPFSIFSGPGVSSSSIGGERNPNAVLRMIPKTATLAGLDPAKVSNPVAGFPIMEDKSGISSETKLVEPLQDPTKNLDYSFRVSLPDSGFDLVGDNVVGNGKLILRDNSLGQEIEVGQGQFVGTTETGVIVRRVEASGTKLDFVDVKGQITTLGVTVVNYRIPVISSTMIQGGASYAPPGNCGIAAHSDSMGYAYDFMGAINAHALAAADGLVVFANQSTVCNFILQACPDFSPNGCPGMYLGNEIVIQHADGTYSALAHLTPNSFQAAVGTSVCRGQFVAIQGHTGSAAGGNGVCGDHVHFQRQATGDFLGQSIPVTLEDAAANPLSCGVRYTSGSTEIINTISPSTNQFTPTGGTGSVAVTSTGCVWSAISNVPWITITNPGSGSGNSTVRYSVAANSQGTRTGTLNIGGKTFTVTQTGTGVTNSAPSVNAGADQNVLVTDLVSLNGSASDDGLPSSSLTVNWTTVSGPGTVVFGNAGSAATTATFSMAGIYVLRLTASDGVLNSQDDVKIVVGVNNGGGSISGSQVPAPSTVNLTSEGTEDWANWGLNSATDFDHKNIATRQISNINKIGARPTIRFSSSRLSASWNDGSPTLGNITSTAGISTYDVDNGFEINAPADTNERILKIYLDVWRCTGRLEATISDGSATPLVDMSMSDSFYNGGVFGVYTIRYRAASSSQFINVRWTLTNPVYPAANVALQAATLAFAANARPIVNAGSDQTITFPGSANLVGSATDDGLPNPPGALTTSWSLVSGPGSVTFGNASQLNTSANFGSAGVYVLRLTASDGAVSASDDITITVNANLGGGVLSVSGTTPPSGTNLSTEGTSDWAHWGLTSAASYNHKSGISPLISNFAVIGGVAAQQFTNSPNVFSWTAGTPTASMSNTPNGVYETGQGNGFQITVPADTTNRTLKIYVGLWSAGGRLEASLSDNSAVAYVDTSVVNSGGTTNQVYMLNYQAASAGQTMTVKWTVNQTFNAWSNVTLQAATLTGAGGPPPNLAPTVNAGIDQAITLPASASLAGTASDDGLPSPPATLTTTWSKVSGPGTITFGNANSLSTTADFSASGTYVIRLTANDGSLSSTDDLTVIANPAGSTNGLLSVSGAVTGSNVNLSTEGTLDWAHWGLSSVASFNHKNGVASLISNYSMIGNGSAARYTNNPNAYSWTGGTPTATATNTQTGVYVFGGNNGFQVTVPADTTQRKLKIYVGVWAASGRLEASLSDGSAPTFVDTSVVNTSGTSNQVYTLIYSAASSGQTLTIKWSINQAFLTGGNVTLQAASVSSAGGTPTNQAPVVNAGSDQQITFPATAALSGTATDDGLPNPPASLTTTWSLLSGPGTVTFGNANALSTSANFSAPGLYSLRLSATDGTLTSTDDVVLTVNSPSSGGMLSVGSVATPSNSNLSSEGLLDWAHWGLTSASSYNHKSGVTPLISNFTVIGSGPVQNYTNNPNTYSWTGGTPTASINSTTNAVYITGPNNGFQITLPAGTTQRILKVYVGLWSAGGKFEAALSDNSAPGYVDTSLVNSTGTTNRVYTLNYNAASAGQTITIKWTVNQTFNAWSNVTLQAATCQ